MPCLDAETAKSYFSHRDDCNADHYRLCETSIELRTRLRLPTSADTYIPEGFVLVPIEIQNSESLSSLIGDFAVVDLFKGPHSQRVGRRLKMLRAPLNPQQFAVLVPEAEVSTLLQTAGPFWVAIQNPAMTKESEIANHSKKSRIEYFQEK